QAWLTLILSTPKSVWTDSMLYAAYSLPSTTEGEKIARMEAMLKLAEKVGPTLGQRWFDHAWNVFHQLGEVKSEATRLALAKRYLSLEATAAKGGYGSLRAWIWPLVERPQIFRSKAVNLLPAAKMNALFDRLKGAAGAAKRPATELAGVCDRITYRVLPQDHRVAFLQANLAFLAPQEAARLADWSKEKDLLGLGKRWRPNTPRELLDYRWRCLSLFSRNGDKAGLLAAAKDYVTAYPGSFDANAFKGYLLYSKAPSNQEKFALLTDLLAKGGYSAKLEWLGKEVLKDKKMSATPEAKAWLDALAKKPVGSDPLMAAHVLLCSTKENRSNPSPAITAAVTKALAAYPAKVSDEGDLRGATLRDLFLRHGNHTWDNRKGLEAWAATWQPRLGKTVLWGHMLNRLREQKAYPALGKALPFLAAQIKAGYQPDGRCWDQVGYAPLPKGASRLPLSEFMPKMTAAQAYHYAYSRHIGSLKPADRLAETERLLNAHPLPTWTFSNAEYYRRNTLDNVYNAVNASEKPKASKALLDALWAYSLSAVKTDLSIRDRGLDLMLRQGRKESLGQILSALTSRPALEQLQGINDFLLQRLPVEGKGEAPKPGFRLHTLLTLYGPALKAIPVERAGRATLSYEALMQFNGYVSSTDLDPALKNQITVFRTEVERLILNGAPVNWHTHAVLRALHPMALAALDRKDYASVGVFSALMAEVCHRDSSWSHMIHNHIRPLALSLEKADAPQILVGMLRSVQRAKGLPADLKRELSLIRSRATRGIQGVYPVNEGHQAYPLYLAADALSENNREKAWTLTKPRLGLLPKYWQELNKDYLAWCAEMMRQQMLYKESMHLCRLALANEDLLTAETAARFYLTKADISRDKKDFPLAAREYTSLKSNRRYSETEAGRRGRY
ncbi:MAG: hypothetical protein ACYTGH_19650, partial [Planctomycetota bacterium]